MLQSRNSELHRSPDDAADAVGIERIAENAALRLIQAALKRSLLPSTPPNSVISRACSAASPAGG